MNETDTVQIVALTGWLILVGGALASHRLNWSKALRMAFVWMAIFMGVFFLFSAVRVA